MFKIEDGRDSFFQWDVNRRLIIEDDSITEVHFCNRTDSCSLVCETYKENGLTLVNVPNVLLQNDWRINVYAFDSEYTKHCEVFKVNTRTKPTDYVYTETEIKRYEDLEERIIALENAPGGSGGDVDLSDYYTKYEVEDVIERKIASFDYVDKYYLQNELNLFQREYYTKTVVDNTFATKEEVGNIEEATAAIIALQNSYIGGE